MASQDFTESDAWREMLRPLATSRPLNAVKSAFSAPTDVTAERGGAATDEGRARVKRRGKRQAEQTVDVCEGSMDAENDEDDEPFVLPIAALVAPSPANVTLKAPQGRVPSTYPA